MEWGISSNGRAPALHAGSTGIDTRILQDQDFSYFSFLQFLFTHLSAHKSREVCYFSLLKLTILKSFFCLLALPKRSITLSLYLQQSRMSKMTGDIHRYIRTYILYLKIKVYKDGSLGLMWTFKT